MSMRLKAIVLGLGLIFFVGGCASVYNRNAKEQIRDKASFQFHCNAEKLTLSALKEGLGGYKQSFAVEGCGKRAIYSARDGSSPNFYMESASGDIRTNSREGGSVPE
jgi:hypothetical protein